MKLTIAQFNQALSHFKTKSEETLEDLGSPKARFGYGWIDHTLEGSEGLITLRYRDFHEKIDIYWEENGTWKEECLASLDDFLTGNYPLPF